jgi:hypothetical protein
MPQHSPHVVIRCMPQVIPARRLKRCFLCAIVLLAASLTTSAQNTAGSIRSSFLHPPDDTKPMVRWWWFGPAVTKDEISRELHQMSADGIGGAELAFVYPLQLNGNLPFTSPAMLDMVHFADDEGQRLGLRIDITLCSGWPYGGPHITLANAATKLRIVEFLIGSGTTSLSLPAVPIGDTFLYAALTDGTPKHWSSAGAQPLLSAVAGQTIHVAVAKTDRVLLLFYMSHTRQQVKRAAIGGEGYVLDPFSSEAVATHLNAVGKPLLSAFGDHKPYAIFSDSLEAYGADWTPALPAEFKKRRGYDLLPHLPQLVAGDSPEASKVRHDYGQTLTELIDENYLTQINQWAKANGTRFRSQTYGEPAVSFSSQRLVDLAEGEGSQWRAFSTLRWASSANHVFGRNVTSGESFTWLDSPVFRATPLDMKAEADVDFLSGENQLIFHGWPYSPPDLELPAGDPGWSLYAAAALNDHNPWHPVMPAVTNYIARISYLLRLGEPANQVAILLPTDDAWSNFSPGQATISGAMSKKISPELMSSILASGYNVDFIDADAIQSAGLGNHQLLLIPPTERIPIATLKKLADFVKNGGHVLVVGKLPTLDAEGKRFGPAAKEMQAFTVVSSLSTLSTTLHKAITPDFKIQGDAEPAARTAVGFIRRSLKEGDIYFVANTSNRVAHMHVRLNSRFPDVTKLNPDTGAAKPTSTAPSDIDLVLAPYESRIYFFNDSKVQPSANDASIPFTKKLATLNSWRLTIPAIQKDFAVPTPMDWSRSPEALHFSGEGIYTTEVTLNELPTRGIELAIQGGASSSASQSSASSASINGGLDPLRANPLVTHTGPGMHADFNAPLREAAKVVVNGQDAGTLWHPPYSVDITNFLKTGTNVIELHVFNTALNAWSALPPRNYAPLKARFGDRFQMQDLDQVRPLPSGILGTVELLQQEAR